MNALQRLRLRLLERANLDTDKAKRCCDFVLGVESRGGLEKRKLDDGIYYIDSLGRIFPFSVILPEIPKDVAYVGIVQGRQRAAVALTNAHEGGYIPLTNPENTEGDITHSLHEEFQQASHDFSGELNTDYLRKIGLNPEIRLNDKEHIPSLGELYLICLNRSKINYAIKKAGGEPMTEDTYWSSSEQKIGSAWHLYFEDGSAGNTDTGRSAGVVRAAYSRFFEYDYDC